MPDLLLLTMLAFTAFLVGSLPTGVLVGRVAGADPRRAGSGNIGATNVTRTLGKKWGVVTLVVDVLKGLLPVVLVRLFASEIGETGAALAGFAAILGHCFTPFLRFKGGKGVATAFGVMLAMSWPIALFSAVLWVMVAVISRVPAIGSLTAAVAFVALAHVSPQPVALRLLTIAIALLVWIRHVSNLRAIKTRVRVRRPRVKSKRRRY